MDNVIKIQSEVLNYYALYSLFSKVIEKQLIFINYIYSSVEKFYARKLNAGEPIDIDGFSRKAT